MYEYNIEFYSAQNNILLNFNAYENKIIRIFNKFYRTNNTKCDNQTYTDIYKNLKIEI